MRDHGPLCSGWGLSVGALFSQAAEIPPKWTGHSNLCLLHDCKHNLQWIRQSSSVIVLMAKNKAQVYRHWISPAEGSQGMCIPAGQHDPSIKPCSLGSGWRAFARLGHDQMQTHTRYVWEAPDPISKHSTVCFIWLTHTHRNENYTYRKLSMYCRNVEEK